jgi:hypothetical protein
MNICSQVSSFLKRRTALNLWLVAAAWPEAPGAHAQEAIRNSLAAQAASGPRQQDLESAPYTIKSGDFRLLVAPSLGLDWNDNINASNTNQIQDFIARPKVQLNASYPITQINLLQFNVGVGYDKYLEHDSYSSWEINSGSQLSFDTYVKDILINLHDRFDYTQDVAAQAVVAETGNYGTANNVAGVSLAWNPKELDLRLGYDHKNTMSLESQFGSQDGAMELVDGRVGWRFIPTATAGGEVTYSSTTYDQGVLNNNSAYTVGVYGEWHPGSYFSVSGRAGYSISQFQQTSQSGQIFELNPSGSPVVVQTGTPVQTSGQASYYADLTVSHDPSPSLSYSFSVGHETQSGVESDAIEDSYLRLSAIWKVIRILDFTTTFSYEHGQQGAGNVTGNLTEVFDYYTEGVGLSHHFTKRLVVGLDYRGTQRASSNASLGYAQNLVGLKVTYAFQ